VTSFNIAAACVTELSGCDYCAEVEIQRTEGKGKMIRRNRPWTPEDDSHLRTLLEGGASTALVAAKLKRSISATKGRASAIGISFKKIKLRLKVKR
jgi:hypothetical protein